MTARVGAGTAPPRRVAEVRALWLPLASYVLVFAAKLVTYLLTGVLALLAEALHTLSDVVVSAFLLLAVRYARRGGDAEHMFGHARAENVAALVAATLFISLTSVSLYIEAVPRLFDPQPAGYRSLDLAVGVLLGSMVLGAVPLVALLRRRERGPAARAQLAELVNDQLGLIAALAGTLLLAAGVPLADPVAAIVVATIIAINAAGLFRDNASLLLGRSPGPDYLARVAATARTVPGVIEVAEIRAELVGPGQVHAGLRVVVPAAMSVGRARQLAEEVRRRVHDTDATQYCAIEVQPPPDTPVTDTPEEVAAMPPHCDSLDGPVVAAARHALAAGDVDVVLPYVPADGEDEVRAAFGRVLPLHTAGGEAAAVAQRWFFETVVRVHRAGEHAP